MPLLSSIRQYNADGEYLSPRKSILYNTPNISHRVHGGTEVTEGKKGFLSESIAWKSTLILHTTTPLFILCVLSVPLCLCVRSFGMKIDFRDLSRRRVIRLRWIVQNLVYIIDQYRKSWYIFGNEFFWRIIFERDTFSQIIKFWWKRHKKRECNNPWSRKENIWKNIGQKKTVRKIDNKI